MLFPGFEDSATLHIFLYPFSVNKTQNVTDLAYFLSTNLLTVWGLLWSLSHSFSELSFAILLVTRLLWWTQLIKDSCHPTFCAQYEDPLMYFGALWRGLPYVHARVHVCIYLYWHCGFTIVALPWQTFLFLTKKQLRGVHAKYIFALFFIRLLFNDFLSLYGQTLGQYLFIALFNLYANL